MKNQIVKIDSKKLVVALSNGWATPQQLPDYAMVNFPLFFPSYFKNVWKNRNYTDNSAQNNGSYFKGFGFWSQPNEGSNVTKCTIVNNNNFSCKIKPFYLAKSLNKLLKVRKES